MIDVIETRILIKLTAQTLNIVCCFLFWLRNYKEYIICHLFHQEEIVFISLNMYLNNALRKKLKRAKVNSKVIGAAKKRPF